MILMVVVFPAPLDGEVYVLQGLERAVALGKVHDLDHR